MKRHFGTDGIRGRAGENLSPELAVRAAYGFTKVLGHSRQRYHKTARPQVIVGSDPRLSSPMLQAAVISGISLGGFDVVDLGIVPTPLVPFTVLAGQAAGGVMITASHNPIEDNGIKLFSAEGIKLGPQQERSIEEIINSPGRLAVADQTSFGTLRTQDPTDQYLAFARQAVRTKTNGTPFKVVLDCAHGATCRLAPLAFEQAGFQVVLINADFDGQLVNVKCGATDLGCLAERVCRERAELGLAFDGDGDRVLAVDELGHPVSGDKIIAVLSTRLKRYREAGAVVMTHMTNIGVELALKAQGVSMVRTEVGDANVLRGMTRRNINLGGEQSGHVIMRDKLPGGDGILVGLQLACTLRSSRKPLSMLTAPFVDFPQVLTNLKIRDKLGWQGDSGFERGLNRVRGDFDAVRFYLRPSGTEDVVRVLTEAQDLETCQRSNLAVCELFTAWDNKR